MVYSREIEGQVYTFGVSGRLYKSNVLLYDHQTESLWSQLLERAISGPLVGKTLTKLPANRTSWKTWKKRNPDTMVLSTETGYRRDYTIDPYEGYHHTGTIWFPVGEVRTDLSAKERVLGIEVKEEAKAYPLALLRKQPGIIKDSIGKVPIQIEVNAEGEVVDVRDQKGSPIPYIFAYWFAWQAFHPKTAVYHSKQ